MFTFSSSIKFATAGGIRHSGRHLPTSLNVNQVDVKHFISKLQFRSGRYVADSTSVTADARFKFKCSRAEFALAADPRKSRAAAPRGWSRSSRSSTNRNRDTYARLDSRRRTTKRTRARIHAGWIDPVARKFFSIRRTNTLNRGEYCNPRSRKDLVSRIEIAYVRVRHIFQRYLAKLAGQGALPYNGTAIACVRAISTYENSSASRILSFSEAQCTPIGCGNCTGKSAV